MGRPQGAVSSRHHHVLRTDPETGRELHGKRVQTLAEAWADIRRRAVQDHAARWRVFTCPPPPAGCRTRTRGAARGAGPVFRAHPLTRLRRSSR